MIENSYCFEQMFTDKYGDNVMNQIAASFYPHFVINRVTSKEEQIKGVDYTFRKIGPGRNLQQLVDLKIDQYKNNNFVIELEQQYEGVKGESWLYHNPDIWIAYFKICKQTVYIIQLADLQAFTETDLFKSRKIQFTNRTVKGKPGTYKNFKLSEIPFHHIVNISLLTNPFESDDLLYTKYSKPDYILYEQEKNNENS